MLKEQYRAEGKLERIEAVELAVLICILRPRSDVWKADGVVEVKEVKEVTEYGQMRTYFDMDGDNPARCKKCGKCIKWVHPKMGASAPSRGVHALYKHARSCIDNFKQPPRVTANRKKMSE